MNRQILHQSAIFPQVKPSKSKRIKQNINDRDWQKLSEAMPTTGKYPVSKSLLYKGWVLLGNYFSKQEKFTEAIKAYNKARIIRPSVVMVFDKLILRQIRFSKKNRELFSKSDLQKFKEALIPVINYHSVNFPKQKSVIGAGERLLNKIDYRIKYEAPDTVETPVTYQEQIIYDALYGDMTIEEVKTEAARILTSLIRQEVSKKASKKKKEVKDQAPNKPKKQ